MAPSIPRSPSPTRRPAAPGASLLLLGALLLPAVGCGGAEPETVPDAPEAVADPDAPIARDDFEAGEPEFESSGVDEETETDGDDG